MLENIIEEKQDIKQAALNSAIKLFIQNGYHATSLQDIANDSQTSKAMTHYYFNGKMGLLVYALERLNLQLKNQLASIYLNTKDLPKVRLSKLIITVEDFFSQRYESKILPFLSTELSQDTLTINKLFQEHLNTWQVAIQTTLNLFYSEDDAKHMAIDSLTYLYGSLIVQQIDKGRGCVEQTCRRLAKLWWSGVKQ